MSYALRMTQSVRRNRRSRENVPEKNEKNENENYKYVDYNSCIEHLYSHPLNLFINVR